MRLTILLKVFLFVCLFVYISIYYTEALLLPVYYCNHAYTRYATVCMAFECIHYNEGVTNYVKIMHFPALLPVAWILIGQLREATPTFLGRAVRG